MFDGSSSLEPLSGTGLHHETRGERRRRISWCAADRTGKLHAGSWSRFSGTLPLHVEEPTHIPILQVSVAWLPGCQVDKEDTENSVPFQCIWRHYSQFFFFFKWSIFRHFLLEILSEETKEKRENCPVGGRIGGPVWRALVLKTALLLASDRIDFG